MDEKTRSTAEARFERATKAKAAAKVAWDDHARTAKAIEDNTARLRAARLARDAAEQPVVKKRVAKKTTQRRGAGSY
ncbi:MAG: hypothetical protein AB7O56_16105 [Bauldia sp.]